MNELFIAMAEARRLAANRPPPPPSQRVWPDWRKWLSRAGAQPRASAHSSSAQPAPESVLASANSAP